MIPDSTDSAWLRRQFIVALAKSEELRAILVLKGGSALALVHEVGGRTSLDLDFSLDGEDVSSLGDRMRAALEDHLASLELVLFDWRFGSKPKVSSNQRDFDWGGYLAEFKVIGRAEWIAIGGSLEEARRRSIGISESHGAKRSFRIELSRSEHCEGAIDRPVDDEHTIRVYTLAMIAAEKLRALCQQMEAYEHSTKRRPRPRDFYDIHSIVEQGVNLRSPQNLELIRAIFEAKQVPLHFLRSLEHEIAFHETEWPNVRDTIPADRSREFGAYTASVLALVRRLEPLWVVDSP